MDTEELIKSIALAAVAVACVIVAAIGFIYIGIPLAIVIGSYLAWRTYRASPLGVYHRHERKLAALQKAISEHAPLQSEETFTDAIRSTFLTQFRDPTPNLDITFRLLHIAKALYSSEALPPSAEHHDSTELALAKQLDATAAYAHRLSLPNYPQLVERPIIEAFIAFTASLPAIAFLSNEQALAALEGDEPKAMFHTSLFAVLPNAGKTVEALILPFYADDLITNGIHAGLRGQLSRNQHVMSGVAYTREHFESPKLIRPLDHQGTALQTINGFLRDTPFPLVFDAALPLNIPENLRFEGTWIIAPPGRGKTTLLSALLNADLERVQAGQASIILMDSKGDLIDHARQLKQFAPSGDLHDRLVLIEPSETLALNPLDVGATPAHTVALLESVFSVLLDAPPTAFQSTLLRKVLWLAQTTPNPTLRMIKDILLTGQIPTNADLSKLHDEDRQFFELNQMNESPYKDRRTEIAARIDALTSRVPLIRDMFQAPKTQINIGKEMDGGKVIIIDNSVAKLSTGSEFFARFFVALILAAAQQRAGRPDAAKLPCYFYIDEADTVIANDTNIASIIDRCRSQKIGLVLAHQRLQQIKSDDVRDALANCAVRIANSDDDASALASRFRTTAEMLRDLGKGQFLLFMRDLTASPLKIDVPNRPVSNTEWWPKMTAEQMREVRRQMRERYCYTPTPTSAPAPTPTPYPASSRVEHQSRFGVVNEPPPTPAPRPTPPKSPPSRQSSEPPDDDKPGKWG